MINQVLKEGGVTWERKDKNAYLLGGKELIRKSPTVDQGKEGSQTTVIH